MPCENYQNALIDLAAGGTAPSAGLRAHLHVCERCRSYLDQEHLLLARIDSGVYAAVNAGLPPAFLERLEVPLAQELPARRNPVWVHAVWMHAAAAVVLCALCLPGLRGLLHSRSSNRHGHRVSGAQGVLPEPTLERRPPMVATSTSGNDGQRTWMRRGRGDPRPAGHEAPEVLVPPEEGIALAKFVTDVRGAGNFALALTNPAPQSKEQPLRVEPLQVASLKIELLRESPMMVASDR
jgi:hypothetical protein